MPVVRVWGSFYEVMRMISCLEVYIILCASDSGVFLSATYILQHASEFIAFLLEIIRLRSSLSFLLAISSLELSGSGRANETTRKSVYSCAKNE
jgi:hypothetical protein